jgi:phasin family protein
MISQFQDFMNEQVQILSGQAQKFGADPFAAVRDSVAYSADGLKSLKEPVRFATRASLELTALSQKTVEELIELQSEMITSALGEVASSLERAASAKSVAELLAEQTEAAKASGERFLNDANRAAAIFVEAGRGVQKVATQAYEKVVKTAEVEARPKAAGAPAKRRPTAKAAGARAKRRPTAKAA